MAVDGDRYTMIDELGIKVWTDIVNAMNAALSKHGPLTKDLVRACAILGREWGEAMNEALLATLPPKSFSTSEHAGTFEANKRKALYAELAQVAATAAVMMENLIDENQT